MVLRIFSKIFFLFSLGLTACSTSQKVISSNTTHSLNPKSVCFLPNSESGKDMVSNVQKALLKNDLKLISGAQCNSYPVSADLIVKFEDSWNWDVLMYLKNLEITMLDKKGDILVTGRWDNATFHKFPDSVNVVNGLVNEMLLKLKGPTIEHEAKP